MRSICIYLGCFQSCIGKKNLAGIWPDFSKICINSIFKIFQMRAVQANDIRFRRMIYDDISDLFCFLIHTLKNKTTISDIDLFENSFGKKFPVFFP